VNKSKDNSSIKLDENIKEIEGLDTGYEAFFEFWCFGDSYSLSYMDVKNEDTRHYYEGTEFK
jgi:hypothetical protein